MIERPVVTTHPQCHTGGPDSTDAVAAFNAMLIDGTMYFPASKIETGEQVDPDGTSSIKVMLARGKYGLSFSYTHEGARNLAAALIRSAEESERRIAAQASAAIEKARKP